MDYHEQILAFRAIDMRLHFPEPLNSFRDALEALQSDRAYLPEMSGEIICYLKNGQSISIPEQFFLVQVPHFETKEKAEEWVLERHKRVKNGSSISRLEGMLLADYDQPIIDQINEALAGEDTEVINSSENDRVCKEVDLWLRVAISALPLVEVNYISSNLDLSTDVPEIKLSDEDIDAFRLMFAKTSDPYRWIIISNVDIARAVPGIGYLDLVNDQWSQSIHNATPLKDLKIANAILEILDAELEPCIKKVLYSHLIHGEEAEL